MRRTLLNSARLLLVSVLVIAWFAPSASASTTLSVPEPTDFYFTFEEPSTIKARAYGQDVGYDTHLWLYDESDNLITQNDDWFGLDSWIEIEVGTGSYRLRAGVCCGDPNAWSYWEENNGYTIEFNAIPTNAPPETTTTVEETTTTSSTTSTTSTTTEPPTTTTTVPQSIGAPLNLTVTEIETGFFLDWDEPTDGNVSPERYAISWSVEGIGGWGWATGNVGDETALITEITVPYSILESTGGLDQIYVFKIRSDNDSLRLYSSWSNAVEILVSTPTATTTTSTTVPPTTTTVPPTTTTVPPTTTVYIPPPIYIPPPTEVTTTWVPTTTSTPPTTTPTTTAPTTTVPVTTTVVSTPPQTTAPQTTAPPTTVLTTSLPPSTEPVVTSVVTPESAPATTVTAVATSAVPVIPETPTSEQLVSYITEITPDQLSDLTDDEISELIEEVATADLSDEEAEDIAVALSDAPKEVKQEFQESVNIFSGQFDSYVPIDSKVPVGTRRVIIVATAAIFVMPSPTSSRKVK